MCWLVLALVLSPALGLVHQVVHGAGLGAGSAIAQQASAGIELAHVAKPSAQHALDTIHALFAGHGKADCVLLDQIALAHALLAKALPLFQPLPTAAPVFDASTDVAQERVSPFHPRGPPALHLV